MLVPRFIFSLLMQSPGCLNIPSPSYFECLNQSLWNLVCISQHWAYLNGALHKSFSSLHVFVCVCLLSVLGTGSLNTFLWQWMLATEELLDPSFSMLSLSYQRSVCGVSCVHPSLLGTNSVMKFPRQRRIVGGIISYAARSFSKEIRRLVLPRTTFLENATAASPDESPPLSRVFSHFH
jgi:hypothetical protein